MVSKILVIGGTGAQGSAIVRTLYETSHFELYVLTRATNSPAALEIKELGNVTLIQGDSYNAEDLRSAFVGIDACYVNTNGFAIGEKDEIYWGIKTFELAAAAGVKHYVYAGLPYVYKRSGYNPKYNVGHLDGKGRVTEFVSAQPTEPMNWTIVNSCLYLEMFFQIFRPVLADDGKTYFFNSAVGEGSAPMINLPDLALYTRWVFENPEKARGMVLDTATEHVNWNSVAEAFTNVTGKPAVYNPVTPAKYGEIVASGTPGGQETRFGGEDGHRVKDNFAAFMEVHSLAVPGSQGLWTVDYSRLDDILPGRIRSVEEWMRKVEYTGEDKKAVLKTF